MCLKVEIENIAKDYKKKKTQKQKEKSVRKTKWMKANMYIQCRRNCRKMKQIYNRNVMWLLMACLHTIHNALAASSKLTSHNSNKNNAFYGNGTDSSDSNDSNDSIRKEQIAVKQVSAAVLDGFLDIFHIRRHHKQGASERASWVKWNTHNTMIPMVFNSIPYLIRITHHPVKVKKEKEKSR